MDIKEIKRKQYNAYSELIDIELFNKIVTFMASTSTSSESWSKFKRLEEKCIWLYKTENMVIQEEYGFKYFGELLERYEERIGNQTRIIRTIALAIGYGKDLIDKNMIVDTQLVDFISKIKGFTSNDIYLKAALYMLDNVKYSTYAEELMNIRYNKTEEIIFVLSVFYEKIGDFFNKNKIQLIELIGKSKTISAIGNVGIYAWLIKNLNQFVYKDRKKDISLLKALVKIPTEQVIDELKPLKNTNTYNELILNEYEKDEIIYLNYVLLLFDTVPKSIIIGKSVIEERIATNLCLIFINGEKTYENDVYRIISHILLYYKNFQIKCYGYYRILDVLNNNLNIINPTTFLNLYHDLEEEIYTFNILEQKWDVIASNIDEKEYLKIFDKFLLKKKYDKKTCIKCIKKYEQLTGKEYKKTFYEYSYSRKEIFNFLIYNNVIFLKDIFEQSFQNNYYSNHVKEYINKVENKKSFEFLKYLLRLNKYSIKDLNSIGFRFDNMITIYNYSSGRKECSLNIYRDFFNKKEQIILFNCVEKYIFYNKPEVYFIFLKSVLDSEFSLKFFDKEQLRLIFLSLCELFPETYEKHYLQKKYLSMEEYNLICEKEKAEKEQEELRNKQETELSIIDEFNELKDTNSLKSLYSLCYKHRYNSDKISFCTKLIKEYILKYGYKLSKEQEDINYFVKLLDLFVDEEKLKPIEFIKLTYEYIKEGVQGDEPINTTY